MACDNVIIHVMVIGFHHKKGCQVEYCYPPLDGAVNQDNGLAGDGHAGSTITLPEEWKHLPTLALPDGAHNFGKDTIYFHLKNRSSTGTVFGVSCYQQMDAKHLVNRTADITRTTVQKSVCVLSHVPLYGAISAKLELITRAYFEQKDFTSTALLRDTYASLTGSFQDGSTLDMQVHYGMNLQDVVLMYKHKILQLFKLILLEKKVLFFMTPVADLCNVLLSIVSLFPGMIERGLVECVGCYAKRPSHDGQPATTPGHEDEPNTAAAAVAAEHTADTAADGTPTAAAIVAPEGGDIRDRTQGSQLSATKPEPAEAAMAAAAGAAAHEGEHSPDRAGVVTPHDVAATGATSAPAVAASASHRVHQPPRGDGSSALGGGGIAQACRHDQLTGEPDDDVDEDYEVLALEAGGSTLALTDEPRGSEPKDPSAVIVEASATGGGGSSGDGSLVKLTAGATFVPVVSPTSLKLDDAGFPLAIFTKGSVLHPYLSLAYYDILEDVHIRSFVIGASNVLFRQKKHNLDVIVEDDETRIHVSDAELRRQLQLTTADLRFANELVQCVEEHRLQTLASSGAAAAEAGWEGSDDWLRAQFRNYITSLMASVLQDDSKLLEDFNVAFVEAWMACHNYRVWRSTVVQLDGVSPRHPCHGSMGMSDVRLRLTRTMQGTERGRKLNAALAVTGKAVGSALQSAKTTVSSWWSGLSATKVANGSEKQ